MARCLPSAAVLQLLLLSFPAAGGDLSAVKHLPTLTSLGSFGKLEPPSAPEAAAAGAPTVPFARRAVRHPTVRMAPTGVDLNGAWASRRYSRNTHLKCAWC
jgi:hypothetical protein